MWFYNVACYVSVASFRATISPPAERPKCPPRVAKEEAIDSGPLHCQNQDELQSNAGE